jgi:Alternative complex III, ActD subunit
VHLISDFHDQQSTAHALVGLKAGGFSAESVEVFSEEPLEMPTGILERPSHMSLGVVSCAIIIALLVIGFVYFAQHNYPLITGGMPLFSFWSAGVVFYEMTMFGAIVTTFFWFLLESGLLRRHRRSTAPELHPGAIRIRVRCGPDEADEAIRCLESAGAIAVVKGGDAA